MADATVVRCGVGPMNFCVASRIPGIGAPAPVAVPTDAERDILAAYKRTDALFSSVRRIGRKNVEECTFFCFLKGKRFASGKLSTNIDIAVSVAASMRNPQEKVLFLIRLLRDVLRGFEGSNRVTVDESRPPTDVTARSIYNAYKDAFSILKERNPDDPLKWGDFMVVPEASVRDLQRTEPEGPDLERLILNAYQYNVGLFPIYRPDPATFVFFSALKRINSGNVGENIQIALHLSESIQNSQEKVLFLVRLLYDVLRDFDKQKKVDIKVEGAPSDARAIPIYDAYKSAFFTLKQECPDTSLKWGDFMVSQAPVRAVLAQRRRDPLPTVPTVPARASVAPSRGPYHTPEVSPPTSAGIIVSSRRSPVSRTRYTGYPPGHSLPSPAGSERSSIAEAPQAAPIICRSLEETLGFYWTKKDKRGLYYTNCHAYFELSDSGGRTLHTGLFCSLGAFESHSEVWENQVYEIVGRALSFFREKILSDSRSVPNHEYTLQYEAKVKYLFFERLFLAIKWDFDYGFGSRGDGSWEDPWNMPSDIADMPEYGSCLAQQVLAKLFCMAMCYKDKPEGLGVSLKRTGGRPSAADAQVMSIVTSSYEDLRHFYSRYFYSRARASQPLVGQWWRSSAAPGPADRPPGYSADLLPGERITSINLGPDEPVGGDAVFGFDQRTGVTRQDEFPGFGGDDASAGAPPAYVP